VIGWWAALAAAAPIEITVWGDLAVDKARDAVVRDIEGHGYRVVRRKDGDTVFQGRPAWKGRVTLSEEGVLTFARPVVGFSTTPPELYTQDPLYEDVSRPDPLGIEPATCSGTVRFDETTDPDCVDGAAMLPIKATFWLAPSKTKLQTGWDQLARDVEPEVEQYLAIKRRTVFEEKLAVLPDALDALWKDGVPLEPGPTLPTAEARRRAVLEFWASRTDTPEGNRTAEVAEDWLRAVVQSGSTPITPEERAEFAPRQANRELP
jgi:hypothetical protein